MSTKVMVKYREEYNLFFREEMENLVSHTT